MSTPHIQLKVFLEAYKNEREICMEWSEHDQEPQLQLTDGEGRSAGVLTLDALHQLVWVTCRDFKIANRAFYHLSHAWIYGPRAWAVASIMQGIEALQTVASQRERNYYLMLWHHFRELEEGEKQPKAQS